MSRISTVTPEATITDRASIIMCVQAFAVSAYETKLAIWAAKNSSDSS
jgi:hypothetical protein